MSFSKSEGKKFGGKVVQSLELKVHNSLNYTICKIVSREEGCAALSAHLGRLMSWFFDVNRSIRNGDEPVLTGDEQTVYIFCSQVIHEHRASDNAYESAIALLGEQGVMEITTLIGYYSAISFVLNVFEIPVPDGEIAPFQRD